MINLESKNFIDYFAVCGLDVKSGLESEPNDAYNESMVSKPPLDGSYKCKILYHFPDNLPWNPFDEDAVTQLCLPKGVIFQKHNSKPKYHPFIITREDGSRIYGGALTFFELIEDESICNAMQTLQTMYDAEFSNTRTTNLSTSIYASSSSSNRHHHHHHLNHHHHNHHHHRSASSTNSVEITNRLARSSQSRTQSITTPISIKSHSSSLNRSNSQNENENQTDLNITNNNENETNSSFNKNNNSSNTSITTNTTELSAYDSILKSSNGSYQNKRILNGKIYNLNISGSSSPNSNNNSLNNANNNNPMSPTKISHYNILKDRLYASKCICLISQHPFNKSFSKILHTLYDMVEKTDLLGINLESHLYNLVYELPMPTNGQLMQFHIGCKASTVYMPDYINANELPLLDYDLFEFFRLLGVSNMINLYITALLEHQILLYSKDYYLLMLVAESLTSLFFPFTWLKPYVPIVPASNLHFIEAPVPYIMGFHHRDIDKEFFKQGQRCFVDIDSGTVTCPEGLPEFPDKNKFIKEINEIIVYFTEKRNQAKLKKQNSSQNMSQLNHNKSIDSKNETEQDSISSTYDILQNSQALARITELAFKAGAINGSQEWIDSATGRLKPMHRSNEYDNLKNLSPGGTRTTSSSSGVSTASTSSNTDLQIDQSSNNNTKPENSKNDEMSNFEEDDVVCMQFSRCIRELFLQRFVQMFASYEKFVIVPNIENNQIENWWMNREYSGNFDSKMFLIEQPSPRLPFLSHFISTQMFVSFIDLKIISIIDAQKPPDPNVKIFDQKIKQCKINDSNIYDLKTDNCKIIFDLKELEKEVLHKLKQEPVIAPTVLPIRSNDTQNQTNSNSNNEPSQNYFLNSSNCDNNSKKESYYLFENIDKNLLKADEEIINKIYNEMIQKKESQLKNREQFKNSQLKLSLDNPKIKSVKEKKSRKNKDLNSSTSAIQGGEQQTEAKTTELNPIFIQSLLKESKLKTKRMLVEKMPEAANLGHGEARISGVEENMLIASLCDLIERIWGHGLHNKAGKSALWNHLNNYRKLIQYLHPNSQFIPDAKSASPTLLWCLMKKRASSGSNLFLEKTNITTKTSNSNHDNASDNSSINNSNSNNLGNNKTKIITSSGSSTLPRKRTNLSITPDGANTSKTSPYLSLTRQHGGSTNNLINYSNNHQNHKRAQSVNNSENSNSFPPLKNDLLADLARIDKLTEIKTEIGMARAFVRLSLEKKLLADHLRQLLSEVELLRALYKRHAFLRQEEEREQFIYHLQSLNVVDYFCFTNHFKSIPTDYSVLIVPSRKFNSSTTSANPYMKLFGSLGESEVTLIPKNNFEFVISCKNNLGPLTTLIIGHDNAGITPKWMIECIFVRNEITGHIHKFPCGRWLGKGVDDDSLERLLIAEPLDHNETYDLPNIQLLSPYSNTSRSRSPTIIRSEEKKLPSSAIQEMVGNTVNTLVKYFEKPEIERGHLTTLMCGENGLVNSVDHLFTFGYKSYKLFKRLYVWDFLEKAAYEFETLLNYPNSKYMNQSQKTNKNFMIDKYISVIKSINSTSANYGKDGKFQIFICLACRDSFLSDWFLLLSKSNTASQMYDEFSFLRNHDLNKFCVKILSIIDQFNFKLENSLTMGINY